MAALIRRSAAGVRSALSVMRVRVLGPVEASRRRAAGALWAPASSARCWRCSRVHANRTVSADALLEGLWGEQPPASAPKMVQQYVSQLRRALGDGGNGDAVEILTRGRGYELRVAPDEVDAARFERLVARRRRRARRSRCGGARRWPTSPTSRSRRRRSGGWRSCG